MRSPSLVPANSAWERAAEPPPACPDIRDALFEPLSARQFEFQIAATERAVLAGTEALAGRAAELHIHLDCLARDGDTLEAGAVLCRGRASAMGVARAEEQLLSSVGKASGVATAAADMVSRANGGARIVCGAWKKVPRALRAELRRAVEIGGAGLRILDEPFVYLDKNYVRMFGGVGAAVRQARRIEGRAVVVQLRGEGPDIEREAEDAVREGASVLMVDTGRLSDLASVATLLRRARALRGVVLAYGGGIRTDEIPAILDAGAQVLDVGRAILDAPLIDFRFDVC